jgi:uncharacterized protein YdhG (YjbR/CyaY superfamily)
MPMKPYPSVEAYIQDFPKEVQTILKKIRAIAKKAAPKAEEKISYGIPSVRLNGTYILHYAAFKKHIGIFPPVPTKFLKEVKNFANPKGNLQIPFTEEMPYDTIQKIVELRVQDALMKPMKKKRVMKK